MKALQEILNDAAISEEEYREVRMEVIKTTIGGIAGRKILPIRKINIGRQEYGFDVMSREGTADIVEKGTNLPGIDTTKARTLVPLLKHGCSFRIAREDLLSSRAWGEPLNTSRAFEASQLTQSKENTTIITGSSKNGVNSVYNYTGIGTAAGSDFGTAGNSLTSINAAWAVLDDEFVPDSLVLNKTQYLQLNARVANQSLTDKEVLEGLGLKIFWDKDITAATGLLMQTGPNIAEVIVAEDIDLEEDYKIETQAYLFNTWLRSVPAVYQPGAICKLTGI